MDNDLQIKGLSGLARELARFPDTLQANLRLAIEEGLLIVTGRLAVYPAAIGGSRYERTGQLGGGWRGAEYAWRMAGRWVEGRTTNPMGYTSYVQGDGMQAAVHAGRWATAGEIIEESQGLVDKLLQEAGERALNAVTTRM